MLRISISESCRHTQMEKTLLTTVFHGFYAKNVYILFLIALMSCVLLTYATMFESQFIIILTNFLLIQGKYQNQFDIWCIRNPYKHKIEEITMNFKTKFHSWIVPDLIEIFVLSILYSCSSFGEFWYFYDAMKAEIFW